MDSLTHIALGATLGEAVLGPKVGRRAMAWGAICGTIPDLDVFLPMGGAVENFTYHRSFSHSVIVLAALTPLIVWAITRLHPGTATQWRGWLMMVFLALVTHPILDSFTVYGTQILWPLPGLPVSWATIFIIDPIYSLPLIGGALAAVFMSRRSATGHRLALLGLGMSIVYLAWAGLAKTIISDRVQSALAVHKLDGKPVLVSAAPLTTLLWRIVVMDGTRYHEGYISLFDPVGAMSLASYPTEPELLSGIDNTWPVQRLKWFTHGFYSVRAASPKIVMADLRMGVEGAYVFSFVVGRIKDSFSVPVQNERIRSEQDLTRLGSVWHRIWDPEVSLAPAGGEVSDQTLKKRPED